MFDKFSLRFKLIASFFFLSVILCGVGLLSWSTLGGVAADYDHVSSVNLRNTQNLLTMVRAVQEAEQWAQVIPHTETDQLVKVEKEIADAIANFDQGDKKYNEVPFMPGEEPIYNKMKGGWVKWIENSKKAFEIARDPKRKAELQPFVDGPVLEAHELADNTLQELAKYHHDDADVWSEKAAQHARFGSQLTLILVGIGVLLAMALGYFQASIIAKSLTAISTRIAQASTDTSSAGGELSSASQTLSSSSSQAAASLEETVASLEELSSMVKTNAGNAQEANAISQQSRSSAELGEKEIKELIVSMQNIAAGSKKIEEIIHVIDDIAFQTNLLALNAAVEAARAGEQGKGFAVVAEAVRNLAQRSALAAKDINALIKENVTRSEDGARVAEKSGEVLGEIVGSVKKVADLNQEISTASQEQATGLEQINKAMNQLDQATQGNAASSEEVAASAEEMSNQAHLLMELVSDLRGLVNGIGKEGRHQETPAANEKAKPKSKSSKVVSLSDFKSPAVKTKPKTSASTPIKQGRTFAKNETPASVLPLDDFESSGTSERTIKKAENF